MLCLVILAFVLFTFDCFVVYGAICEKAKELFNSIRKDNDTDHRFCELDMIKTRSILKG